MLALVILATAAIGQITSLSEEKPATSDRKENALPRDVRKILDNADRFVLLSLDPKLPEKRENKPWDKLFYDYRVLRKMEIPAKARDELLGALYKGIADSDGEIAMCFKPRHGIRATMGGETVDLVICFQCLSIQIHGKTDGEVLTTGLPAVTFNRVLGITELPPGKQSPQWKIASVALAVTTFTLLFICFKAAKKSKVKYLS